MGKREIIILGGGGQACVVMDMLVAANQVPAGYVAPKRSRMLDIPHLGDDSWLLEQAPGAIELANGLGTVGNGLPRSSVYVKFTDLGFTFITLVHAAASVSASATIMNGAQVLAGAVVGPYSRIGRNAIINMNASLNHHCMVEDHGHVSQGVVLCGEVKIGRGALVGAGATIVPGVTIGADAVVAAGSAVIGDLPDRARARGVPAREF